MAEPMSPIEGQKSHMPENVEKAKENPHKGSVWSFLKRTFAKPEKLTPAYGTGTPTGSDISSDNNADTKPNVFAAIQTPVRPPEVPSKDRSETAPVPTEEEARQANAGEMAPRGIAKIMIDAAKNHPIKTGAVATVAVVATTYGIPQVHRSVNSAIAGWWNSMFSEKQSSVFQKIPAGRTPDEAISQADLTELPLIKPYIQEFKSPGKDEVRSIPFPSVFTFRINPESPQTETIKVFTPEHPEGTLIEVTTPRLPNIYMQGYVLAKEQTSDGLVLIAVGIPKDENQLFSSVDLDKPGVTSTDDRIGGISDVIVWLRIPNLPDYQRPLKPELGWSLPDRNGVRSAVNDTTDPSEIFKYIKIGDAVFAGGYNPPYLNDKGMDTLQQNYKDKKGKVSYEEAVRQYLDLGNLNAATVRKMIEDVSTGKTSLREQLETKRYVITARSLRYIVDN